MKCPRCSLAEIVDPTQPCRRCGFLLAGSRAPDAGRPDRTVGRAQRDQAWALMMNPSPDPDPEVDPSRDPTARSRGRRTLVMGLGAAVLAVALLLRPAATAVLPDVPLTMPDAKQPVPDDPSMVLPDTEPVLEPEPVSPKARPAPPTRTPRVAAPPSEARPRAPARSREPAHLFVSSTPWGALYVDGLLVGNTPQANIPITPGLHRIRIEHEGFAPFEREMAVDPGIQLRLVDIVLAAAKR